MKIWILGGEGMVGSALLELLQESGIEVIASNHAQADICNLEMLKNRAAEFKPTHIVNCAALTNVDLAEQKIDLAFAINAHGAGHAAQAAQCISARLVHLSTDYVFDGKSSDPYVEEEGCAPVNIYGTSKWEGEKAVGKIMPSACILRTSWLFGKKGKNFVSSLLRLFQEKEELEVALDHIAKPTYCKDVAQAILALLDFEGVIHFANATPLSREEVARSLLDAISKRGIPHACRKIIAAPKEKFPTLAPRPFSTLLDTKKYENYTGQSPRSWEEIMKEYLDEVL